MESETDQTKKLISSYINDGYEYVGRHGSKLLFRDITDCPFVDALLVDTAVINDDGSFHREVFNMEE